jgi:hypothetical protein
MDRASSSFPCRPDSFEFLPEAIGTLPRPIASADADRARRLHAFRPCASAPMFRYPWIDIGRTSNGQPSTAKPFISHGPRTTRQDCHSSRGTLSGIDLYLLRQDHFPRPGNRSRQSVKLRTRTGNYPFRSSMLDKVMKPGLPSNRITNICPWTLVLQPHEYQALLVLRAGRERTLFIRGVPILGSRAPDTTHWEGRAFLPAEYRYPFEDRLLASGCLGRSARIKRLDRSGTATTQSTIEKGPSLASQAST